MTDPTTIDLEAIRPKIFADSPTTLADLVGISQRLFAAVEALRERVFVADTEVTRLQTANAHWHIRVSQMKTDAEAAEARVGAVVTTLEFITNMEGQDGMTDALFAEKTLEIAHITLASASAAKESAP